MTPNLLCKFFTPLWSAIPKPFSGLFCMSYIYLGDTDISESDSVWELKDQEGKQKKVTALIIQLKKENETK